MHNRQTPYRVLVIEDEFYIADDLVRALGVEGILVVGPVASQADAIAELDGGDVDFALVDINLDGSVSFELAAKMRERRVPFLFHTGYEPSIIPIEFEDVVFLQKPMPAERIAAEIWRVAGRAPS